MCQLEVLRNFNGGQIAALIKAIGGQEAVGRLLRNEVEVTLTEIVRRYFDKNGRGIPDKLQAKSCAPDSSFKLERPDILANGFLQTAFERGENYLGDYLGRDKTPFEDYRKAIVELWEKLQDDEHLANLAKGTCLPLLLPQMSIDDLGTVTERLVETAGESYKECFPDRTWSNYRKGALTGNVSTVSGTRHERIIAQMADGPVSALYFPNPMQGFSVHAQREFEQILPESVSLTGTIEPAVAMTMYPKVLAHSYYTTGLECSAVQYKSSVQSLRWLALVDRLWFDCKVDLDNTSDWYSGGLLFVG